jgi:uncharacterized protein
MTYQVDWVIKASKLCNFRCEYCYEWDELANKERMSLDLWSKILVAARDHLHLVAERHAPVGGVRLRLVWHGGEPLLLPVDYYRAAMALQKEVFPADWLARGTVRNVMQTNLYSPPEPLLELLREERFGIGVSFDGVPGVRLTAGGRPTEERVLANIERAQDAGFEVGVIVVLAGHTAPHITEIYDLLRDGVSRIRILPLFDGPGTRPMGKSEASSEVLVDALCRLFVRWFENDCTPPIVPLNTYLQAVIMTMIGVSHMAYDRRRYGDNVFIVNLDGKLYTPNAGYRMPLGDLWAQTIRQILDGASYERSLEADDRARASICGGCAYLGGCTTYPLFSSPDGSIAADRCLIAKPVSQFIEGYLRQEGVGEDSVNDLFQSVLAARPLVDAPPELESRSAP